MGSDRALGVGDGTRETPRPSGARSARSLVARFLVQLLFLGIAAVAYGAHEHLALAGQSGPALASLVVAAGFALAPVRVALRIVFAVEGKVLHLVHGAGGLALIGLTSIGVLSGGPLLTHAASAPFAMMGAAQALMRSEHPRNREEAEALRGFAASVPRVREFTGSRDLASPANVRRAVAVLGDLLAKAQALGELELRSDPGFQSALRQATARLGLSLGLDAADRAIRDLAANPAATSAVPDLRRRLATARETLRGEPPEPAAPRRGAAGAPRTLARHPGGTPP